MQHTCTECASSKVVRHVRYTPDFFLHNGKLVIEAKGKFTARDRKLAIAFRQQYPERDYRMMFQRDNWLTKAHKMRYSDWCKSNGIEYIISNHIPSWWYTR